ncbi:unnamed protein product [Schistosoma turkestanicum]|nr:unnamed protein product [Schistosoma turkestanicum]
MNSSQISSGNENLSSTINDNRQTVLNRLNERHTQNQQKKILNNENIDSHGNKNTHENFLQQFTQYKLAIIKDLDDITKKLQNSNLPMNERTQFVDDILARLENMQNWLNETSMYLTSFDNEQARLELKVSV